MALRSENLTFASMYKIQLIIHLEYLGPDASRPPCRKAKLIRREKREAKLAKQAQEALARGESPMEAKVSKPNNTEKSLEDYLNEPLPANPAHNLEVCTSVLGQD